MNRVKQAVSEFEKGFSCSQAIFSVYGASCGFERENALKIATAFGGGMGRMGNTCGAVTGAFMALGLKHGRSKLEETEAKEATYRLVQEFIRKFQDRNDSIICRELLGYSLSNPAERQLVKEQDLLSTRCIKFVKDAAEILEEIL